MLRKEIFKYILDIEAMIDELEKIVATCNNDFNQFESNFIFFRAAERDLMIIGESISKILQLDDNIKITSARQIVSLRNMIVHSYDSIDSSVIWKILQKDMPVLKDEIKVMRL